METHVATRMGCSLRRYQFEVMMTKAGETAASAKPRKKRAAARPWKFWVLPMAISTPPQTTMVAPTKMVMWKRERTYAAGYSEASWPR